jgi:antitoxin Phd
MVTKTSAQAQNQFGQLLDLVQREPVAITRHGRPAAYVISPREMEDFQAFQEIRRRQRMADWREWSEQAKKNMRPEAAELTDEDIVRLVHELR